MTLGNHCTPWDENCQTCRAWGQVFHPASVPSPREATSEPEPLKAATFGGYHPDLPREFYEVRYVSVVYPKAEQFNTAPEALLAYEKIRRSDAPHRLHVVRVTEVLMEPRKDAASSPSPSTGAPTSPTEGLRADSEAIRRTMAMMASALACGESWSDTLAEEHAAAKIGLRNLTTAAIDGTLASRGLATGAGTTEPSTGEPNCERCGLPAIGHDESPCKWTEADVIRQHLRESQRQVARLRSTSDSEALASLRAENDRLNAVVVDLEKTYLDWAVGERKELNKQVDSTESALATLRAAVREYLDAEDRFAPIGELGPPDDDLAEEIRERAAFLRSLTSDPETPNG